MIENQGLHSVRLIQTSSIDLRNLPETVSNDCLKEWMEMMFGPVNSVQSILLNNYGPEGHACEVGKKVEFFRERHAILAISLFEKIYDPKLKNNFGTIITPSYTCSFFVTKYCKYFLSSMNQETNEYTTRCANPDCVFVHHMYPAQLTVTTGSNVKVKVAEAIESYRNCCLSKDEIGDLEQIPPIPIHDFNIRNWAETSFVYSAICNLFNPEIMDDFGKDEDSDILGFYYQITHSQSADERIPGFSALAKYLAGFFEHERTRSFY